MSQFEASSFNSWALGAFAVPGEGNLMIRVFRGMGKSIPTHGGIFFFSWPIGFVAKGAHKLSFVLYLKVYLFIYLFLWFLLSIHGDVVSSIKPIPCDDLIDMSVKSSERP